MAEEALKKLEQQLNCAICLETYNNPKLLRCFHVYCRDCLVKLVVRDQQGQLSLPCPSCRYATPIPSNGVSGFPPAFQTNQLLEIWEDLKKAKDPVSPLDKVENDIIPSTKSNPTCSEHQEESKLYCETCGELICIQCTIRKHHSHRYDLISEVFEGHKKEINLSLQVVEEQLGYVNKTLTQLDVCCKEMSNRREAIAANISGNVETIHQVIEEKKAELLGELNHMTQKKMKGLAVHRDQLETTQVQLSTSLDFVKERLTSSSQGEILKMKATMINEVEELTAAFKPEETAVKAEIDMTFTISPNIISACKNFGQLYQSRSLDPSKSFVIGQALRKAVVREKSSANLHAINFEGEACEVEIESIQCELLSTLTGAIVEGDIIKKEEKGLYEISYQPVIKGKHHLTIKIKDQHIKGSPFSVTITQPVEKLGNPILIIEGVHSPSGVAINEKGEIIVTENDRACVSIFNSGGKKIRSFGTHGSDLGEFLSPGGVAVDDDGNILVVDGDKDCIQKFTADGQFLTAVGPKSSGDIHFRLPHDIAFNTKNDKVYLVDSSHHTHILNSNLTFYKTFGEEGNRKGQFTFPGGVACDSNGKVYVADRSNHRIQVFTSKGQFLKTFGKHGQGRGELSWPDCVTVDSNDMVYVGEYENNRVSVFTSEGQFVTSFGKEGKLAGEFKYPAGLAVDNSGVLYVCDFNNHRLQIF